ERQRERARAARQDVDSMQVQSGVLADLKVESRFIGYDELETEAQVLAIIKDGELQDSANSGEEVQLILDVTPFYAESGGQIADEGTIESGAAKAVVQDVQKAPNGQNLHRVFIESGTLQVNDKVYAAVDRQNREKIIKNHSATHLLHQALKDVLGGHVNQAGSLVAAERLRFDFSHFGQVREDELERIDAIVNEKI